MDNVSKSATSISLLHRLRDDPSDQISWKQFVLQYGPRIHWWCLGWGLQAADAEDVTQNVLLRIAKHMAKFEYKKGGRFRSWLRTVTHHALCDYLEQRKRIHELNADDAIYRKLDTVEAREQLLSKVEEEYERQILSDAMEIASKRVEPKTWAAFVAVAVESKKAEDVASELGMKVGSIYVAKTRIKRMLTSIVQELDNN